jgi:hypothetical protein
MAAQVPLQDAGIDVEAGADLVADGDGDGLALVEIGDVIGSGVRRGDGQYHHGNGAFRHRDHGARRGFPSRRARQQQTPHHVFSPIGMFLLAGIDFTRRRPGCLRGSIHL